MLQLSLFRIPAFTGTAVVAFAQSVALCALLLFVAVAFVAAAVAWPLLGSQRSTGVA